MFRSSLRQVRPVAASISTTLSVPSRRLLTTGSNAPKSKGTWKGTFMRWGAAGAAVYIYNASPLFQDPPQPQKIDAPKHFDESDNQTIDAVIAARREQIKKEQAAKAAERAAEAEKKKAEAAAQVPVPSEVAASPAEEGEGAPIPGADGGNAGAYNPETGEINWDCPCLGGMAYGPCGEEFRSAFSCFVYSEVEPKGMDCIEKFQGMQTCFRAHPDVYGAELDDDEAAQGEAPAPAGEAPAAVVKEEPKKATEAVTEKAAEVKEKAAQKTEEVKEQVKEKKEEVKEQLKEKEEAKAITSEKKEQVKEAISKKAEETKEKVIEKREEAKAAVTGKKEAVTAKSA